jgi:AcrR family transcriptional regulator
MSVAQRRQMIVAAALPLVAEYGTAVTTSQIARAAGIGEATIFRAFADKDEVLGACMAEAVRSDHVVTELASIPAEQPLEGRLTDAVEALRAHLRRMGAVAGALHTSGMRRREARSGQESERPAPNSREESLTAIRDAVADLIEADAGALRLPTPQLASVFLGMMFTNVRQPVGGPPELSPAELVDVFLHGAVTAA